MKKGLAPLNWSLVAAWMAIIFYLSSQSSSLPSILPDFIPHFIEYAILAFLLLRALKEHQISKPAAIGLTVLIALIYAASDEIHQSFVPTRTASLSDFLVDSLAAFAIGIYGKIKLQ